VVLRGLRPPGVGTDGAHPLGGEEGSQTLELAGVLPAVVLLLVLLLQGALYGADLVTAQGLAREAARAAAVDDDAAVRRLVAAAAGGRDVTVRLDPESGQRRAGQLVRAEVVLRSRAFTAMGVDVDAAGLAVMRVEQP
jgi:hypothetical protein